MKFEFNNIKIDTAETFNDIGWETAITDGVTEWIILQNGMNLKEALKEHGKVIAKVLSGQTRFKNAYGEIKTIEVKYWYEIIGICKGIW